jgi:hypothetical protein
MKLRNINTGEEVEGNFYKTAGFWQQDTPRMVSYHESQWVPVEEEQQ